MLPPMAVLVGLLAAAAFSGFEVDESTESNLNAATSDVDCAGRYDGACYHTHDEGTYFCLNYFNLGGGNHLVSEELTACEHISISG